MKNHALNRPLQQKGSLSAQFRTRLWLLSATLLFCLTSIFFLDKPLTLYLHQFNHGQWHDGWKIVTLAGQSEWYLAGGIILYAWFRNRNGKHANAGLFLVSTVAVSGILANILKIIFGKARPKLLLQNDVYGFDFLQGHIEHAWTSFPSGHSATALSVAMTLSLLLPRFRPLLMAGAFLVILSRLTLCQHYLSDVAAGSMLGAMTVALLYQHYFRTALNETGLIHY